MVPPPICPGLTICNYVLIEERTTKVSTIGAFNVFRAKAFPFSPLPFCVFTILTGGHGDAAVELMVTDLESDEEVVSVSSAMRFRERFSEVRVLFRLSAIQFLKAGAYLFTLLVDGDWVAHKRVRVYLGEDNE